MIKEISLLTVITFITLIYNYYLYPCVLLMISVDTHNFILVFTSILVQIDNISLLNEIKEKERVKDNIMENRYLKMISNQLYYISNKIDKLDKNKIHHYSKNFKSCGNLSLANCSYV